MKKVNELNITINKALITEINIRLSEDEVIWNVSGQLLTDKGLSISSFNFSNLSWLDNDKKLSVSLEANILGKRLFESFTPEVLKKLGSTFMALPEGK